MSSSDFAKRIEQLSADKLRLLALQLEQRLRAAERNPTVAHREDRDAVAIVGVGCRYPGGIRDLDGLWRVLREARDCVAEIPSERWDNDAWYDPNPDAPGKVSTRWAGMLEDLAGFDARFFGLRESEAAAMDPQQRLVLEVAWEALERAGLARRSFSGTRAGVFIGAYDHEYSALHLGHLDAIDAYTGTGIALNAIAGRLSYLLDLRGPSMVIDTACSSSLVAVHLACRSLRSEEVDFALAGGVNVLLTPMALIPSSRMGMLAKDGCCKVFDARADGVVISEGCGVVALMRLADARARGLPIRAVIRGSAVNQDGRSNGLTAPNVLAQGAVFRAALADAGIAAEQVSLIEAHGTGTALGDPIELEAVASVYGAGPARCWVSGVKANLGHAGAAAGIAGLLKLVACFERGAVPPQLHLRTLNPNIDLAGTRLSMPRGVESWPSAGAGERIAALNSFGWSGTNVHLILAEAPAREARQRGAGAVILPLSARSRAALRARVAAVRADLIELTREAFVDRCWTAAVGRDHHEHRCAFVADSPSAMIEALDAFAPGSAPAAKPSAPLALIFSGQGSLWAGAGAACRSLGEFFHAELRACEQLLGERPGALLEALDEGGGDPSWARTERAQQIIFATQLGLAAELRRALTDAPAGWGAPVCVLGHSVGEVAAAVVAGALTRAQGMEIVRARGSLMAGERGRGRMVSLRVAAAELASRIVDAPGLAIAAINGPRECVLAGDVSALEAFVAAAGDLSPRWLELDYAFHGPRTTALRAPLERALAGLVPNAASTGVRLISTVTGAAVEPSDLVAAHWGANLSQPVRFADAVTAAEGAQVFVEIGLRPVLVRSIAECLGDRHPVLATMRRNHDGRTAWLHCMAALYAAGRDIRWEQVATPGCIDPGAPTYPWEHRHYWPSFLGRPDRGARNGRAYTDPQGLLRERLPTAGDERIYPCAVDLEHLPFVADHRYFARPVVPGAVWLSLSLAVSVREGGPAIVEDFAFMRPLVCDEPREVQLVLGGAEGRTLRLASRRPESEAFDVHAVARLVSSAEVADLSFPDETPEQIQTRLRPADPSAYHDRLAATGLVLGPTYRDAIRALWVGEGEALVKLAQVAPVRSCRDLPLCPLDLDLGLSSMGAAVGDGEESAHMPIHVERLVVARASGSTRWAHLRISREPDVRADVSLFDERGRTAEVTGLRVRPVSASALAPIVEGWPGASHLWLRPSWRTLSAAVADQPVGADGWRLLGEGEFVDALAAALTERGQSVVRGTSPSSAGLAGVVDCRALGAARDVEEPPARAESLVVGAALLLLMDGPPVWLLTHRAWAVIEGDHARAEQAPLWGLARSVARERDQLGVGARVAGLVDVGELGRAEAAALADELVRSRAARPGVGETRELALRGGRRHVLRLLPAEPSPNRHRWRDTVLITGGLGGLGLALAGRLLERGATRLVLASRRAPSAAVRAQLALWQRAGKRVDAVQLDVADAAQVEALIAELGAAASPLRAVIHAAGVVDDALASELAPPRFSAVLSAKTHGAHNLDRALAKHSIALDVLVLFGSLAAVHGAVGQANYAAANSYLQAFARARAARGERTLCIDWCPWARVGMAARLGQRDQARLRERGLDAIEPSDALVGLELAVASGLSEVCVFPAAWLATASHLEKFSELAPISTPTAVTREHSPRARHAPQGRSVIEATVARLARRALGVGDEQPLADERPLAELGLDSLGSVELRNALAQAFDTQLPATLLFDFPSLRTLTDELERRLGGVRRSEPVRSADAPAEARIQLEIAALSDHDALAALLAGGAA